MTEFIALPLATTSADWSEDFEILGEDNEPIVLTDVIEIIFQVYNEDEVLELEATLTGGDIVLVDGDTKFRVEFSRDDIATVLVPFRKVKTFDIGCTIEDETGFIQQPFLGTWPIYNGRVR